MQGFDIRMMRKDQLRALIRYLESQHIMWSVAYDREKEQYKWTVPPGAATAFLKNTATRRYRLAMWVLEQLKG